MCKFAAERNPAETAIKAIALKYRSVIGPYEQVNDSSGLRRKQHKLSVNFSLLKAFLNGDCMKTFHIIICLSKHVPSSDIEIGENQVGK